MIIYSIDENYSNCRKYHYMPILSDTSVPHTNTNTQLRNVCQISCLNESKCVNLRCNGLKWNEMTQSEMKRNDEVK